jgi:dTDP-4-amino-4,6-dideoxygalactose transaminase
MESEQFIPRPEVERLEAELAAYCGARYAMQTRARRPKQPLR